MSYLLKRFSNLGPNNILLGGYTNEFISGPMVSPYVWGSLASASRATRETVTFPVADTVPLLWTITFAISVQLPEKCLTSGDGMNGKEFDDQLNYSSDIPLVTRVQ